MKTKIQLHIIFYNESKILPYVMNYWANNVDLIIGYDNYSTDNSAEIFKSYPNTIYKMIGNPETFDDLLNKSIKNNAWKQYKEDYNWAICVDADELLFAPFYRNLKSVFKQYDKDGVTICKTIGFDVVNSNKSMQYEFKEYNPAHKLPLWKSYKNGHYRKLYSKRVAFNAQKLTEINYNNGAHQTDPKGLVNFAKDPLYLCHYKHLGKQYELERIKMYKQKDFTVTGTGLWYEKCMRELDLIYKKDEINIDSVILQESKMKFDDKEYMEPFNRNKLQKQFIETLRKLK